MNSALVTFLKKARRRYVLHAVAERASEASCAAVIGLLALLLLGTQVLNWYWPAAFFALSFLYGVYRLRGRIPTLYRLAQRIDQRLALHDTLSTAYHFRGQVPSPAILYQLECAERAAAEAPLATAVPTPVPRSSYVLVGLLTVAGGLFAARYLVMHTLDLQAPIAQFRFSTFEEPKQEAKTHKSAIQERFDEQMQQMGLSLDPVDEHPGDNGLPDATAKGFTATPDGRAPVETSQKAEGEGKDGAESDATSENGKQEAKNGSTGDSKDDANALPGLNTSGKQNPQSAQNQGAGKSGQSSSMLDKMRDAMANLMAKLKPNGGNQQQASSTGGTQDGGQQQRSPGQQNAQSQNKSNGDGQRQGAPNGEGEGSEQTQAAAAGRSGDKGNERSGGQDSKSGMGKQDGDKSIQDAEQLAAMGKISEIIGRRSAQLQGEMTVEVPSGKQQLKTAYTKRHAGHGDAGGELTREEIPLMLQPYVQRYFDEIRKVPPPARTTEQAKTRS